MSEPVIGECDCCGAHDVNLTFVMAYGIETYACSKCRGHEDDDE